MTDKLFAPSWLIVIVIISESVSVSAFVQVSSQTAAKLHQDLFVGYNSHVRPVPSEDQTVSVSINCTVTQIFDIDLDARTMRVIADIHLYRMDAKLRWVPGNYDDIMKMTTDESLMWQPDILVTNALSQEVKSQSASVMNDGQVTTLKTVALTLSCPDFGDTKDRTHICGIEFASGTYGDTELSLGVVTSNSAVHTRSISKPPGWTINSYKYGQTTVKKSDSLTKTHVIYQLTVTQQALSYVLSLALPIYVISMLTLCCMFLCVPINTNTHQLSLVTLAGMALSLSFYVLTVCHNNTDNRQCLNGDTRAWYILSVLCLLSLALVAGLVLQFVVQGLAALDRDWPVRISNLAVVQRANRIMPRTEPPQTLQKTSGALAQPLMVTSRPFYDLEYVNYELLGAVNQLVEQGTAQRSHKVKAQSSLLIGTVLQLLLFVFCAILNTVLFIAFCL